MAGEKRELSGTESVPLKTKHQNNEARWSLRQSRAMDRKTCLSPIQILQERGQWLRFVQRTSRSTDE